MPSTSAIHSLKCNCSRRLSNGSSQPLQRADGSCGSSWDRIGLEPSCGSSGDRIGLEPSVHGILKAYCK